MGVITSKAVQPKFYGVFGLAKKKLRNIYCEKYFPKKSTSQFSYISKSDFSYQPKNLKVTLLHSIGKVFNVSTPNMVAEEWAQASQVSELVSLTQSGVKASVKRGKTIHEQCRKWVRVWRASPSGCARWAGRLSAILENSTRWGRGFGHTFPTCFSSRTSSDICQRDGLHFHAVNPAPGSTCEDISSILKPLLIRSSACLALAPSR